MLPIATPPNAVIFGSGQVDIKDMIKAGISLNLIAALVVTILSIIILNLFFGLQITSMPDWAISEKLINYALKILYNGMALQVTI